MFIKSLFAMSTISLLNNSPIILQMAEPRHQLVQENKIIDFASVMKGAVEWEYHLSNAQGGKVIDSYDNFQFVDVDGHPKDPTVDNMKVIPIGQPNVVYEDKTFNYMGHSVLKNNSDIEQTGSTPSYSKSLSSEVSVATSFGISCEAGCDFEIFDSKVSTNINTTNTQSTTVTKTYSIPPQNIVIPPKSQVTVNEYWSQVKMNQKVQFDCDISGYAMGTFHIHYPDGRHTVVNMILPLAQEIYSMYYHFGYPGCPDEISANDDMTSVHFVGQIDCWDAGAGSSFNLDIGDPEPITT